MIMQNDEIFQEYLSELREYETRAIGVSSSANPKGHDALIITPGKFENEPCYVLYFWNLYLHGFYDDSFCDGCYEYTVWYLDSQETELFNIGRYAAIAIWENSEGFVCHELFQTLEDIQHIG